MKPVVEASFHFFLVFSAFLAIGESSAQADWSVDVLSLPAHVTAIEQDGDAVYVKAGSWFQVSVCGESEICLKPGTPTAPDRPSDGIPRGEVATIAGSGIVSAWYSEPTGRYGHGVLGDRIEAGALVAVDADGRRYRTRLDPDFVFEDLTPRLADINGDGTPEIVTIRSRLDAGASIAIYGLRDGGLPKSPQRPPSAGQTVGSTSPGSPISPATDAWISRWW